MTKVTMAIPVNSMADLSNDGISIGSASFADEISLEGIQHSHRDDYHLFLLQEEGVTPLEIDFEKYELGPKSVLYIYPNQVHRIGPFLNGKVSFCIIDNENLLAENLALLSEITPLKPIVLSDDAFQLITETVSLCIKISEDETQKLHRSLVKESCNLFIRLVISQYLALIPSRDKLSRFELINKAFRGLLEQKFLIIKRPGDYAKELNISTEYLYECVKKATGFSVSYHIEQRVILEAKRLLYYSQRSVKQISSDLGFDDYPYFIRLFGKVTGMTPVGFRKKTD